jgi:hypothetical protein
MIRKLLPTTAAVLGALAAAAPLASADATGTTASNADVCAQVQAAGPMAVLGPYGPLGDYGPGGQSAGQVNPAAGCGGPYAFALPGFDVGSFVSSVITLGAPAHG